MFYTILLTVLGAAGTMEAVDATDSLPPPPAHEHAKVVEEQPEDLTAYIAEALEGHPALRRLYEAWQAALAKAPQAGALDDPMFTYGQFIQSDTNRVRFALSQKLPWFGVRGLRTSIAEREAEAALHALFAEKDRVVGDVRVAFANYARLAHNIHLAGSQLELIDYVVDVEQSRYALGLSREYDLLRAQTEQELTRDRLNEYEAMRGPLSSALAVSVGRRTDPELPWPSAIQTIHPLPPAPIVMARVRSANQSLLAQASTVEQRGVEIELAKKSAYPDVTIGLDYVSVSVPRQIRPDRPYPASLNAARRLSDTVRGVRPFDAINTGFDAYALATTDEPISYRDGGDDNLAVTISVNLPIWRNKIRGKISEARHRESAEEYRSEELALNLENTARRMYFDAENAERRYRLFAESLIPKAEQAYESLQSAYALGTINSSFTDVLDGVQTLIAYQQEQLDALYAWHVASATLERLMGGSWDDEPDAEFAPTERHKHETEVKNSP